MDGNPCKNRGCRTIRSENCKNKTFFVSVHAVVLASFSPALTCLCRVDLPAQIGLKQFAVETVKLFLAYVYKGIAIYMLMWVKSLLKNHGNLNFIRKCGS